VSYKDSSRPDRSRALWEAQEGLSKSMFHDSKMMESGIHLYRSCNVSYIKAKEMAMWLVLS